MKKISKLTFAALLTLGLGFTACGGTDGPSYGPVERIAIGSLSGYAVVGDVIDLDELIKVYGGAGETDYTITVKQGSEKIVSVEGHKVTILAEGEFQLVIKAGEMEGVFTGNAIAKLKNELNNLFTSVKKAKKWALAYSDIDEEGNVVLTGEKAVHAKNYFIDSHDDQDEDYNWICGGLLVAGDGKTYGFEADDADGTNINVFPGALSNFSNYFCNMGLAVDVSKFVVETEEFEDGTTLEYLRLSTDYPSTKYSDYFSSKVDEIACSFFGTGMSDFEEMGAVINDLEVYPYENEDGSYEFEFYFTFDYQEETYVFESAFLTTDPEIAQSKGVEDYIASGEVPEALDFSELTAKVTAAAESKNYAFRAQFGFIDSKTLQFIDWTEAGDPDSEFVFMDGVEEGVVNENISYSKITQTKHYDDEGEAYETPIEVVSESGMIEHDGKVYQFNTAEDGSEDKYVASQIGDATSMWEDLSRYLATVLVPGEGFAVNGRYENEDGSIDFEVEQDIITKEYAQAVAYQTMRGMYLFNVLQKAYGADEEDWTKYIGVDITVSEEGVNFLWYMRFTDFYVGFELEIYNIGGENVAPITEADINFAAQEAAE